MTAPSTIAVRYDVVEHDTENLMLIRAASRATAFELVIIHLAHPIHRNPWLIGLLSPWPTALWNLPTLTGWHPSYLARDFADMAPHTAEVVVGILEHVAPRWEQ